MQTNQNDEPKRFDETYVECTECSHYWNDACDGVPKDKVRSCTSYKATKKVDYIERLRYLESEIKSTNVSLVVTTLALLLHILVDYIWG